MFSRSSYKKTIGLIIDGLGSYYHIKVLNGASRAAQSCQVELVIFDCGKLDGDVLSLKNRVLNFIGSSLGGLIICDSSLKHSLGDQEYRDFILKLPNIPICHLDRWDDGFSSYYTDNFKAVYTGMQHLYNHHNVRRFALIGGDKQNIEVREREEAFYTFLRDNHLEVEDDFIFKGDLLEHSGQLAAESCIKHDRWPLDAVVSCNDCMAIGFIKTMEAWGLYTPEDYKIIGFDNHPEAHLFNLTTLYNPIEEVASEAVKHLIDVIHGDRQPHKMSFDSYMVIRESCGCVDCRTQSQFKFGHNFIYSETYKKLLQALLENIHPKRKKIWTERIALFISTSSSRGFLDLDQWKKILKGLLVAGSNPDYIIQTLKTLLHGSHFKEYTQLIKELLLASEEVSWKFMDADIRLYQEVESEGLQLTNSEESLKSNFVNLAIQGGIRSGLVWRTNDEFWYEGFFQFYNGVLAVNPPLGFSGNDLNKILSAKKCNGNWLLQSLFVDQVVVGVVLLEVDEKNWYKFEQYRKSLSIAIYIESLRLGQLGSVAWNSIPVPSIVVTQNLTVIKENQLFKKMLHYESFIGKSMKCFFEAGIVEQIKHAVEVLTDETANILLDDFYEKKFVRVLKIKRCNIDGKSRFMITVVTDEVKNLGFSIIDQQFWKVHLFTPKKREVIELLATEMNLKDIAADLGMKLNTLKAHVHQIYSVLGLQCRTEIRVLLNEYRNNSYWLTDLVEELEEVTSV